MEWTVEDLKKLEAYEVDLIDKLYKSIGQERKETRFDWLMQILDLEEIRSRLRAIDNVHRSIKYRNGVVKA